MKKIFSPLFLILFFFACAEDTPDTPKEVILTWQDYMDINDFESAKKLSTPEGQKVITNIEELLTMDDEPIPIDTTDFISMVCVEKDSIAVCRYSERLKGEVFRRGNELIRLEEEIVSDSFVLKKINGNWRVNLSENF